VSTASDDQRRIAMTPINVARVEFMSEQCGLPRARASGGP
jgi:hypothetical protein